MAEQTHYFDVIVSHGRQETAYRDVPVISHSKEHASDVGIAGWVKERHGQVQYRAYYKYSR